MLKVFAIELYSSGSWNALFIFLLCFAKLIIYCWQIQLFCHMCPNSLSGGLRQIILLHCARIFYATAPAAHYGYVAVTQKSTGVSGAVVKTISAPLRQIHNGKLVQLCRIIWRSGAGPVGKELRVVQTQTAVIFHQSFV